MWKVWNRDGGYYGKHESVDGIHGERDALKNTTVKALIIG